MADQSIYIKGKIIDRNAQPIQDAKVTLWHWDDNTPQNLRNTASTDSKGRFNFTLKKPVKAKGDEWKAKYNMVFFVVEYEGEKVADTRNSHLWSPPMQDTEITIDADLPKRYQIEGHITHAEGAVFLGFVDAFDIDTKGELKLGTAQTDSRGMYNIYYDPHLLTEHDKTHADVQIRVYEHPEEPDQILGESEILSGADKAVTIDLVLDKPLEHGAENAKQRKRKPIAHPLQVCHKGDLVLELQLALIFLRYKLLEKEAQNHLFGRTTRQAVLKFQKSNRLPQTGIVDEATAKKLNAILEKKGYFNLKTKPFSFELLRMKNKDLNKVKDSQAKAFIQQRLWDQLLELILVVFQDSSDQLRECIKGIDLDIDKWADKTLKELLCEYILPYLMDVPELADELDALEEGFEDKLAPGMLRDLLHLDQAFRDHPFFREEALHTKNVALGRMAGLEDQKIKKIAGLQLDYINEETWDKLIEENTLNPSEREELQRTVEFAKLSDDNFSLIKVLRDKEVRHTRELVNMDPADWKQMFEDHNIEPPEEDDLESYAENITTVIEQAYPSRFFLHRTIERDKENTIDKTRKLTALLKKQDADADDKIRLFNQATFDHLNWDGVDEEKRKEVTNDLIELQEFSNTYRHLEIADILEAKGIQEGEKIKKINQRLGLLRKFNENNPELDLRISHLFPNGKDVPEALRPNLKGIISEEDQKMVLKQMRSFQRLMYMTEDTPKRERLLARGLDSAISIARMPEDQFIVISGFTEKEARPIYQAAALHAGRASHALAVMHENFNNAYTSGGLERHLPKDKQIFKALPGYDDLFGSQNYCSCTHCRSIFSPAAYFVDLMEFIKEQVLNRQFRFCPDHPIHLKTRRPDLWILALTCNNTNTLIPYLQIVVEILEQYLEKTLGVRDIFADLAEAETSLYQPFNLPLESLRLYLQHFRVELSEVYELIGKKKRAIAKEQLGFSKEEFNMLTTTNGLNAKKRFGQAFIGSKLVKEFLKSTRLSREELDQIMKAKSIVGIENVKINPIIKETNSQDPDEIFETLGQGLEEEMSGLSNRFYREMYFFLKTWRAVPWTISELNRVLQSLESLKPRFQNYRRNFLIIIADLLRLQKRFDFSVEQLISIYHQIPHVGGNSLFRRLFSEPIALNAEINLELLNDSHATFSESEDVFAALQSALGISAIDLQRLAAYLKAENEDTITLDLEVMTASYRYAKMAKGLGLSVTQLIFVETHLLQAPKALAERRMQDAIDFIFKLSDTVEIIENLPFSIDELVLLITGLPSGLADYTFGLEDLRSMVEGLLTDTSVYFTTEKLAETGSISTEDSQSIVEQLAAVELAERQTVYRLKDQYVALDEAAYDRILDAFTASDPALRDKLEANREAIISLLESNRRNILPGMLLQITDISREESIAVIQLMNDELEMLALVFSVFRLNSNWDINNSDVLQAVIHAFQARAVENKETEDDGPFNRLANLVSEKSEIIREILNPYHTPIPGQLGTMLGISQERHDAIAALLNMHGDDSFISKLENLMISGETPFITGSGDVALLEPEIQRLERMQKLTEGFGLGVPAIIFIQNNRDLFNYLDDSTLFNWAAIQDLFAYSNLLKDKDAEERQLVNILMRDWNGTQTDELASLLDVNPAQFLLRKMDRPLLELVHFQQKVLALRELLQMDGRAMEKLAGETFQELKEAASIALNTIKAKYEENEWRKVLEPIEDKLRSRKRDAMVDYMLSRRPDLGFKDANELTHYFLIDVSMEGCARISRIKAAILSLQLYVHYYRMGLEKSPYPCVQYYPYPGAPNAQLRSLPLSVRFYAIADEDWLWRKNYRVWEANRRVFTYPECYIEPDLRDNKTELFKEFESLVFQKDAGKKEVVEEGYQFYLKGLNEVANLKIEDCYFHDNTHYFIGKTQLKPPVFFLRSYSEDRGFSEWERIDLEINSPNLSIVMLKGRQYLFWTQIESQLEEDNKPNDINPRSKNTVKVLYSFRNEVNEWARSQEFSNPIVRNLITTSGNLAERWSNKIHLIVKDEKLYIDYLFVENHSSIDHRNVEVYFRKRVDFFKNKLIKVSNPLQTIFNDLKILYLNNGTRLKTFSIQNNSKWAFEAGLDYALYREQKFTGWELFEDTVGLGNFLSESYSGVVFIPNQEHESIIRSDEHYFLMKSLAGFTYTTGGPGSTAGGRWSMERLSSAVPEKLGELLSTGGLNLLLKQGQRQYEPEIRLNLSNAHQFNAPVTFPNDQKNHPNFTGAFGTYFREVFFHLPYLIANHLNSIQKFEKADYCYRQIFDPTQSEPWRYIEFRNQEIPSLFEVLTDSHAMEVSESDPFNPHAIARLRLSAYMKNIVMKYIDNLLDWGDKLFARDTFESINEALMLYIMASDVLGERPYKLGACETTDENSLSYQSIEDRGDISGVLIEVENFIFSFLKPIQLFYAGNESGSLTTPATPVVGISLSASSSLRRLENYRVTRRNKKAKLEKNVVLNPTAIATASRSFTAFPNITIKPPEKSDRYLAFCVPPNDCLYDYWDRVEDRLFKIRNCMNIEGVQRQLSLFEPRIDPMVLVRAKAAGLSLEDILDMLSAKPPAYRFSYVLEKAKEFTRTMQSFGNTLLSALEKKDAEELTLLRSLHEQELLNLVEQVKKESIVETKENITAIEKSKETVTARFNHYDTLLTDVVDESTAHNQSEDNNLQKQEESKNKQRKASDFDFYASILNAVPTTNASIGWGKSSDGKKPGMHYDISTSIGTPNIAAALTAKANYERKASTQAGLSAGLTSTKSGYNRRKQDWQLQKALAEKEGLQINQQLIVAEVRQTIAEKDLETHKKQITQSREVYDLYKNKFTNLGLYTYLSTELSRLYRQAYNMALDLARQAERAYHFEREQTYFIKNDNWAPSRAGLLAGERLLIQLQQMEKAYMEKNLRDYEINQSFSILQLAPDALIRLKESGNCAFAIPEAVFDLVYPGYYQRRIKSVRITIPCVTGPYTNVNCKLSLQGSQIRNTPTLSEEPFDAPNTPTTSIATSTAQNDSGVFELNFRDERYLPFEGAGAISSWTLSMPEEFRAFDYNSISDVILHISYTAKFDGGLRSNVHESLMNQLNNMITTDDQESVGLARLFSLKHEFANAFHALVRGEQEQRDVTFELNQRHFPMLFMGRDKEITAVEVMVVTKSGMMLDNNINLNIRGVNFEIQDDDDPNELTPYSRVLTSIDNISSGNPEGEWSIQYDASDHSALNPDVIDNLLILVRYVVA